MSDIFQLDDETRIVVEQDTDAECPRVDWDMITGFVNMPGWGDSRLSTVPEVHSYPGRVYEAWERFESFSYSREWRDRRSRHAQLVEMVERWSWIFSGIVLQWDVEHGGFWFCDPKSFADNWPDLAEGSPESRAKQLEVIAQEQETYRQWAEGEVIGVILQKAQHLARVQHNGSEDVWELVNPLTDDDITVEWEDVHSIWNSYPSGNYGPAEIAAEFFDLTPAQVEKLKELV